MAIPSLTGVETALSGLEAEQAALDTTGNNIDNASTPGYSEEVVNLAGSTPESIPATGAGSQSTQLGTGVDLESITRVRDQFLDTQYRAQNTQLGNDTTTATQLSDAQTALGESSSTTGISSQLSQFYSDWNSLADNPSSLSAQQALVDDATTLAQSFNSLSSQLTGTQTQSPSLVTQAAQQFSALTASGGQLLNDANEINSLNQDISQAIASGQSPNQLEDQRDSALDDLSTLGQVSTTTGANGQVTVNFGDASEPLVAAGSGTALGTVNAITGITGSSSAGSNPISSATGGELGALITLSSTDPSVNPIAGYSQSLDTVANDLVTDVNHAISAAGGTTAFFTGDSASTIAVNSTLSSAVKSGSTTALNSNAVATAVAALQGGAPDQSYAALVEQVGDDVKTAQTSQTNQQAVVTATEDQRESVSGVSLDQEMTNLISEQRGYQASAQTLNTLNSVLNTLISEVGSAGM